MLKSSIVKFGAIIVILSSFFLACCRIDNADTYDKVIILYMAANNNLDSYARENVSALKTGYIPMLDDSKVLLLFKHLSGETPVLVRIYKNSSGLVQEEIVKTFSGLNSASAATLEEVLTTVKDDFNASEYGLILWSHSTGWLPEGYFDSHPVGFSFFEDPFAGIVKSFAYDNGEEMELTDLADAITFKFSFIIFDACFNGGIETIYELKDKADYIVASPTEILATGFPYNTIMEPLFKDSDLQTVCNQYYDYYTTGTGYNAATISIYKCDQLTALAQICYTIFQNNRAKISALNMSLVQPYFRMNKHWFYDMEDFIRQIASAGELSQFHTALSNVVIDKWYTDYFLSIAISRYSGISTYVSNPSDSELDLFYKRFKWNIASGMVQ